MNHVIRRVEYDHSRTADRWRLASKYWGIVLGCGMAVVVGAFMAALIVGWFSGAGNRLPELMR